MLCLVGWLQPAWASSCRSETFEQTDFTVCSFDPAETDIQTFWRNADGAPFLRFSALADDLDKQGLNLGFAMNGGMYSEEHRPLGLYIEDGETLVQANTADAPQLINGQPPNFYRKPNGIFFVEDGEAGVLETETFLRAGTAADFATQSGPMLVIDGALHQDFIPGSSDRTWRNGVGVDRSGDVHFAISEDRVNFHDFARLFRDRLDSPNALFLDGGSAPGLYAPALGRDDRPGHGGYGPLLGVVE